MLPQRGYWLYLGAASFSDVWGDIMVAWIDQLLGLMRWEKKNSNNNQVFNFHVTRPQTPDKLFNSLLTTGRMYIYGHQ